MDRTLNDLVASIRKIAAGPHWPAILATVLALTSFVEASIYAHPDDRGVAMLVALCTTVPLVFVERRPVLVALVITGFLFVMLGDSVPITASAVLAELVAVYVVASRTRRRTSALFLIPFVLNAMFPDRSDTAGASVLIAVLVVAAVALGDARRLRDQAVAERDASRGQVAETLREQAAMEERARIARELHDVVAHHVSMIAVQAETARLTTPDLSEQGRQRFDEIAVEARDALSEMRRLLGVLRADAGGGGELEPQPGLAQLQELIEDARAAGTPVRLSLEGQVVPLSPTVDLAAYRIIQEALTNTRRHAPDARVEVDLRYEPDGLSLTIRDDGPGPGRDGTEGNGLLGMRERAELAGGWFRTSAPDSGGFLVEATLPTIGQPSEAAP